MPSCLSWALFLGVSWTWCIGMYLPVLLVRDMGFWGWVIFAIPNVVGAAAMGWVLRNADAGSRVVREHRPACIAFSIITIAFHVFFVGWMVRFLIGPAGILLALIAAAVIWACMRLKRDGDRWSAAVAWLISLALGLWLLGHGQLSFPSLSLSSRSALELAALAPVCLVGFALCPYLDLTFHRARQSTGPAGGRWAFGVGFGVVFLLMILLSLGYALPLDATAAGVLGVCVGLHLAIQSAFTVAAHLREIFPSASPSHPTGALLWTAIAAIAALASVPAGEVGYRVFMGFYGLAFPAYVWIFMGRGSNPRSAWVYLVVLLLAGPMFAAGFIGGFWIWLWPGAAILLLGRPAAHYCGSEGSLSGGRTSRGDDAEDRIAR